MPIAHLRKKKCMIQFILCVLIIGEIEPRNNVLLRHESKNYHLVIVNNAFDSEVYTKPLRYSLLLLPLSFR